MAEAKSWFREELERAKRRNETIPPHARMVITDPAISAHRRTARPAGATDTEGSN